jgi:23S rRNA (guanine745-N1)-methyltransferase
MSTSNKPERINTALLRCPICGSSMEQRQKALVCEQKHSFDQAATGYVNLLQHRPLSHYDKALFRARRTVTDQGFFEPLQNLLTKLVLKHLPVDTINILDAGCGEGSLFSSLVENLRKEDKDINAMGIDISKEGIQYASRLKSEIVWLVADIANIPVQNTSMHVILNNLSPGNYHHFHRILHPEGIVLKIIPNMNYLREFRILSGKEGYDNRDVKKLFSAHFGIVEEIDISAIWKPAAKLIPLAYQMTPLSWRGQTNPGLLKNIYELHLDLCILVGKTIRKPS